MKTLLVAQFEFIQTAKRWQFLMITLMLPLFIAFISWISYASQTSAQNNLAKQMEEGKKILVEDHSGIFPFGENSLFVKTEDVRQSALDLMEAKIIAGLIIPKDYLEKGQIDLVLPKIRALGSSRSVAGPTEKELRKALLQSLPGKAEKDRVFDTVNFSIRCIEADGSISPYPWIELIVPVIFLIIFILSMSTASTFLLQSVSEEKENRTMEILLSMVTDRELIWGKVIGLGAAALMQVLIWTLMCLMVVPMLARLLQMELDLSAIPPTQIIYALLVLLLGFLLFAAIMVGVGSLGANFKDSQQLSTFFVIASFLPLYVVQMVINDIHGKLAIFLFYFPLTSPIVLVTRHCLGNLSPSESLAGLLVLAISTLFAFFLAAKLFRLGCLTYNRRPSWKEVSTLWK